MIVLSGVDGDSTYLFGAHGEIEDRLEQVMMLEMAVWVLDTYVIKNNFKYE